MFVVPGKLLIINGKPKNKNKTKIVETNNFFIRRQTKHTKQTKSSHKIKIINQLFKMMQNHKKNIDKFVLKCKDGFAIAILWISLKLASKQ